MDISPLLSASQMMSQICLELERLGLFNFVFPSTLTLALLTDSGIHS